LRVNLNLFVFKLNHSHYSSQLKSHRTSEQDGDSESTFSLLEHKPQGFGLHQAFKR